MGRLLTLVATFALAALTLAGLGGVASAGADPAKELFFQIRSGHSDMCLESNPTTAVVRQHKCGAPSIGSQRWTVVATSHPKLVRIVEPISDRCLDVRGAGTTDGTPVGVLTCDGGSNQVFTLIDVPTPGGFEIRPRHALDMCLDVKNDVPDDGAPLQLWTCLGEGQTNQHFTFVSI
jgi:hypothetical protein